MTPQEQIQAALRVTNVRYTKEDLETIRRALEFTQRAMGEPSRGMILAGNGCEFPIVTDIYEKMTAQLWKEVCDES